MNNKHTHRLVSLILTIAIFTSPALAQQRRTAPRRVAPAAAREPAPTFDSLIAADTYKVYCEIRSVGGLIQSSAVNDIVDPMMKLGNPGREVMTVVKWLKTHANELAGSRMLVAAWPSRPNLPMVVVAIEFSSPDEVKKFFPELRDFLPQLLPTPTPSPSSSPSSSTPIAIPLLYSPADNRVEKVELVPERMTPDQKTAVAAEVPPPSVLPYQMTQSGSLVLISDKAFKLRDLRPHGSKALEEDQNFLQARTRFASESVFLYVDLNAIEKEEQDQQKKREEEVAKRAEAEKANPPKIEELATEEMTAPEMSPPPPEEQQIPSPEVIEATADPQPASSATLSAGPAPEAIAFSSLYGALFGGETKWPEAIAAALVFEGDAYVVRTLIINKTEDKSNIIPFLPQLVSGPAIVSEGMLKAFAHTAEQSRKYSGADKDEALPESPFAIYEQKLGLKIKDDLLPLLGNELALALPKPAAKPVGGLAPATNAGDEKSAGPFPESANASPNPIIAISVKDREAVGRLIPKIIDAFGLKGASLLAQSEKRDGTEIVSYAGIFSYAFVGNFLVLSPDPAETRHVVDAYLNHQTLSSDSHFRNSTRWQPRQMLGQVYVAPELIQSFNPFAIVTGRVNVKMNDFISRLSPLIEATTYALTNDGAGPLHELHIPRNLLLWTIGASFAAADATAPQRNEMMAKSLLRGVYSAEMTFKSTEDHGGYATLDELSSANLISKEMIEKFGYRIDVIASGEKFTAIAMPLEYGVSGTISYFIDETGNLRGGDHGGGPASASDQPIN
jgi:hypothetical protein